MKKIFLLLLFLLTLISCNFEDKDLVDKIADEVIENQDFLTLMKMRTVENPFINYLSHIPYEHLLVLNETKEFPVNIQEDLKGLITNEYIDKYNMLFKNLYVSYSSAISSMSKEEVIRLNYRLSQEFSLSNIFDSFAILQDRTNCITQCENDYSQCIKAANNTVSLEAAESITEGLGAAAVGSYFGAQGALAGGLVVGGIGLIFDGIGYIVDRQNCSATKNTCICRCDPNKC